MSELKIVSLRDICKQAKVPPKVARARLRNARSGEVPRPVTKKRWAWKPADATKVKKYIAA